MRKGRRVWTREGHRSRRLANDAKSVDPDAQAPGPAIVPLDEDLHLVHVLHSPTDGQAKAGLGQLDAIAPSRQEFALSRLLQLLGRPLEPVG
jgi:hypothetical protein